MIEASLTQHDYDMHVDRHISASLATAEFEDASGKTRMKFTEHAVYTRWLLDGLGEYLERTKAAV